MADLVLYDELAGAEASMLDAQRELEDCRARIKTLQEEVTRKALRVQQCHRIVQNKRQFIIGLSRIERLPDETISLVFLHLVEDFDSRYPWMLMSICKRWKKICLENPRLWSFFDLAFGHRECPLTLEAQGGQRESNATLVLRTMLQMERSCAAPLFVRGGDQCDCTSQVSRFRAMMEHSSRWQEFSLTRSVVMWGPDEFLRRLVPQAAKFARLQKLEWGDLRPDHRQLDLPFADDSALPKLRVVSLKGAITLDTYVSKIPWGQLTDLSLLYFSGHADDFLLALSFCQGLESLRVLMSLRPGASTTDNPPQPPTATNDQGDLIVLPNLVNLAIKAASDAFVTQLIQRIQCPSLQTLNLSSVTSFQLIFDLLQRSACSGRLLKLLDLSLSAPRELETFAPLLRICPNLGELRYTDMDRTLPSMEDLSSTNELIRSLVLQDGSELLCPRLQKLSLTRVVFDPVLMVRMVDSRIGGKQYEDVSSTCLESLDIVHSPTVIHSSGTAFGEGDFQYSRTILQQKYMHALSKLCLNISMSEV